ncbi:hypothetical protein PF003_g4846 [Phytophthora fragariae]|nr:hypothetical protein PF003_g4846 [Phytophthora fragariae]
MVPGSLPAAAKSLLGFGSVYYVVVKNLLACSDGGAVSIWCMGMFLAITNFFLERMSGIRMMVSFGWFSTLVEVEDNEMDELSEGEHGHERLPPEQNLPMVPWYSMLLFDTVFDLLISLKDAATRSRACLPSQVDCEVPDDKSSGDESESEEGCSGKKKTKTIKRVFPRGEALVIGGDLAYPHPDSKTRYAVLNVFGFRRINWRFDAIGYFAMVFSAMGMAVSFTHCIAAFTILLVYECLLEVASVRGSLGREGEHTLYLFFSSTLPDFSAIRQYDIFGLASLYGDFMRLCMAIFDVPEVVALHRNKICASGFDSLGRMELWTYYASLFPYFWVLATPVVSFVFGTYLYLSLNMFGCHYNEAFLSLRIASYKNFLRLHFDKEGRLEIFAFGVDKMPRRWCRDPKWSGGNGPRASLERNLPSFKWTRPSYWKRLVTKVDNMLRMDFENPSLDAKFNTTDRSNVHLIDRVLVRKPASAAT